MIEIKELEEKTNDELKSLIEDLEDNQGATINIDAKNPNKPNKTELITALVEYYKTEAEADKAAEEVEQEEESLELEEPEVEVSQPKAAKDLPRSKRIALQRADLTRKECVVVTDQRKSQTPDKAMFVSWGNRGVGYHTDVIYFTNKPQYIRRGALNNLKNVMLNEPISNADNPESEIKWDRGPRFIITPAAGLSADELRKKVVEQQIKRANAI